MSYDPNDYLKDLITISEAAKLLHTTEATLRTWVKRGKLRAYTPTSKTWYFRKSEIAKFILSTATGNTPGGSE